MRASAARLRSAGFGLAALAPICVPAPAIGASASATFSVTANVQATCLVSVSDLAFGNYTGVAIESTATITVICTNSTNYYVNIQTTGTFVGPCWSAHMTGPNANVLQYFIYREAARASCWGNTVNNDGVGGTGNGSAQTLTVYGRLPAGQFKVPGTYADTAVVTVTY